MNKLTALFAAALCVIPAHAQEEDIPYPALGVRAFDELVPEPPAVAGLRLLLIRDVILLHKFRPVEKFEFHALGIPTQSEQAEFAIGFSARNMIAVQLKAPLAATIPQSFIEDVFRPPVLSEPDNNAAFADLQPLMRDLGTRVAKLEVEQCRADLDPKLGERLATVWKSMLERTRFPQDYQRLEWFGSSDEYHFSFNAGGGWGGTTLSGISFHDERAQSKPGLLVGVARAMRDYCMSKDTKHLTTISNELGTLETRLKEPNASP
jgi:hypothetical protein